MTPVAVVASGQPGRSRLLDWAGILSAYFTFQTIAQVMGLLSGLLLVNFMPIREFALYTLASSVIGFCGFASDLGSTSSLLYFFQRAAAEGGRFDRYFAAVLSLRRRAFVLGAVVATALLPWMAVEQGFGRAAAAMATGAALLAVHFQIAASLRILSLRLHDRYAKSYRADLGAGAVRLVLTAAQVATGALFAWLGVLAAAIGSAVSAALAKDARTMTGGDGDLAPYRSAVLRYLLPTLPGAFYFAVQGPLVIWLAAAFGSTQNVAEVGALGRLGLIVGLFSGLSGVVFLPRLAQTTDERRYRRRYCQYGGLLLAFAVALIAASTMAPRAFLWLLGGHYAKLETELSLVVATAGISLLGGYAVGVNNARSWTRWQGLAVLGLVAAQASLVVALPLDTTMNVLIFNLLSAGVGLLVQLIITAVGFVRPSRVLWA